MTVVEGAHWWLCHGCFRKKGIAVLYSYDIMNDRYTSVYLSYNTKKSHIRVGIQPYLESTATVVIPRLKFKDLAKEDKLYITLNDGRDPKVHVMLSPFRHARKTDVVFTMPLSMITPDNVRNKVGIYLLMS